MRADSGALPLDGVTGARDCGREADAVLGVADIVVHRLRDGDDLDAYVVELGCVTERVVAADGDQMFDAKPREVRQHLAGKVPRLGCDVPLGTQGDWKVLADDMIGQLLHFGRIGAARVQHGAAAPVDGASVLTIQRDNVVGPAGRVLGVQVREGLPAAAGTDDLVIEFSLLQARPPLLMAAVNRTSPPPVRMPMRLLTMPNSQDWRVLIIGGPLAIRHRRAAKPRMISIGVIADRARYRPRQGFRHLNAPRQSMGFHPTGNVQIVSPQVVSEFVLA